MKQFREKIKNNPLPVIFVTLFLNAIGFGILIPIIPLVLADPRSSFYLLPPDMNVSDGYVIMGFLTGVYPLAMFLATPILGELSDKYGRKKILAISLFGTFLSYVLFGFALIIKNLPLLFISRIIDGITGGNISVAQAAIADVTKPEHRAKNFGLIGASFGLGFVLGPYIGGKLSDPSVLPFFDAATPFWFAAILAGLDVLFILFIFHETLQSRVEHITLHWGKAIKNVIKAYSLKDLRVLFLTNFLFFGGFTFFTTFFSVFLIRRFGFAQGNIGDFFSYVGLWVAFTQAVLTRRLAKKFREQQIVRVTLFGSAFALLLFLFTNAWWQLLIITPIFAMCNGLTMANLTSLVSRSAEPKVQGEVLGINASIQALAQGIPPILSGYIAASIAVEAPVLVSSITVAAAGLVFLFLLKLRQPVQGATAPAVQPIEQSSTQNTLENIPQPELDGPKPIFP